MIYVFFSAWYLLFASKSAHELDPQFFQMCCMISNFCSHSHISRSQFKTSIFFIFLVARLMTFALSPSKITFVYPWLQQTIIAPSKACSSLSRALCGFRLELSCSLKETHAISNQPSSLYWCVYVVQWSIIIALNQSRIRSRPVISLVSWCPLRLSYLICIKILLCF